MSSTVGLLMESHNGTVVPFAQCASSPFGQSARLPTRPVSREGVQFDHEWLSASRVPFRKEGIALGYIGLLGHSGASLASAAVGYLGWLGKTTQFQ